MKLRNKKTGEIIGFKSIDLYEGYGVKLSAESLAELNDEWEDYEEPKEHFVITCDGKIITTAEEFTAIDECEKIGNYFETREEAEKAVKKLKAWKRLKDKGFKVELWDYNGGNEQERISTGRILFRVKDYKENDKDLDLLFGGEE